MQSVPVTLRSLTRWIRRRARDAHKGTSGRVLVVAGSKGMAGAAVLTSAAAVRSGAGLVRLAIVESQQRAAVIRAPLEITTQAMREDRSGHLAKAALPQLKELVKKFGPKIVAVGPGLGVTAATAAAVRWLLYRYEGNVVLDADGLNCLAGVNPARPFAKPVVITPHEGELARLLKIDVKDVSRARKARAIEAAKKFRCVCILKGPGTLITDGKKLYENTTGNPAMASGGMGDMLTGLVAATWAQSTNALESAAAAVFIHGLCADIMVKSYPERTLLASDLLEALPGAYKRIWRKA